MIGATIVYMALENIVGSNMQRRWILTFVFGIVHGFGFLLLLMDSLQLAGDHLVASLLAFNLRVEIGQFFVIILLVPALHSIFQAGAPERREIILSAFAAHAG